MQKIHEPMDALNSPESSGFRQYPLSLLWVLEIWVPKGSRVTHEDQFPFLIGKIRSEYPAWPPLAEGGDDVRSHAKLGCLSGNGDAWHHPVLDNYFKVDFASVVSENRRRSTNLMNGR